MTRKLLYLFFILFSLLDLYLTNYFLNNTNIEESNPIANFIFSNFGLIGLMFLKTYSIIIFTTCCLFIGKYKKPIAEKNLLIFGLSLMIFVVMYSYYAISTEHLITRDLDYYLINYCCFDFDSINYSKNLLFLIIILLFCFITLIIRCLSSYFMIKNYKDKKYEDYEGIEYDE